MHGSVYTELIARDIEDNSVISQPVEWLNLATNFFMHVNDPHWTLLLERVLDRLLASAHFESSFETVGRRAMNVALDTIQVVLLWVVRMDAGPIESV